MRALRTGRAPLSRPPASVPAARGLTALRPILATKGIPSKVGRATLGISGTALHALSERLRPLTVGSVGIRGKDERSGAVWRPDKSPVGLRDNAQLTGLLL